MPDPGAVGGRGGTERCRGPVGTIVGRRRDGGGGVCDLATADELKAAFSVESVTTQVFAGPPGHLCGDGAG